MNDKQEAKFQELTGRPVGHLVCKMAVPTIISMMVTACYNMVDTYFVGQLHSNSATGAVGVVFSLMAATISPASWAATKPPTPKKWPPPA